MGLGLCTDFYQLTMAQAYLHEWDAKGVRQKRATFDLFVRSMPPGWTYLIACGIDEALVALRDVQFTEEDIAYLRKHPSMTEEFLDYLRSWRFEGDVAGVAEGTPIFPNEPILEVSGDIIETQLVETMLLSIINYQTLIASKASRIVAAADPLPVIDFGLRRAPGLEAGIRAARAAFIAGVTATSNVEAGRRYGIPVKGTHAHSYVMAHDSEYEAFVTWCRAQREPTTLLIDTYDVERGAANVVRAVKNGCRVSAVRIDSGDLVENAQKARAIFSAGGMGEMRIILSGDLNEQKITDLRRSCAPVDGFGVGTEMVTARPEAALGGVYKLVELDGKPRIKMSPGKATWPGRKQVWRCRTGNGEAPRLWHDEIWPDDVRARLAAHRDQRQQPSMSSFPLLITLMDGGEILPRPENDIGQIADYCNNELERIRGSFASSGYMVKVSDSLRQKLASVTEQMRMNGDVP